jgi:RHS repeat-associated protein
MYAHNVNGQRTQAGSRTFGYDLAGRMTSTSAPSTAETYTYDGDGNRLTDGVAGGATTTYAWDTNAPAALLASESTSGTLRKYIYGNGPVSMRVGSTAYYYLTDAMRSVADLTSAAGATEWTYTYEPYGAYRSATKVDPIAPANAVGFDGEHMDASTGAYDLRARMYDPGTGSFLQSDPIGRSPSYAFASGDPTRMSDPSGMSEIHGGLPAEGLEVSLEEAEGVAARTAEAAGGVEGAESGQLRRVGDFRSNQAAFEHYAAHVQGVDLRPMGSAEAITADLPEFSSFPEYRSAARAFMGGGAEEGVLEGVRPGGDLVRLDPKSGYFGVRSSGGVIRTFFRPTGGPQQWLEYYTGQFTP